MAIRGRERILNGHFLAIRLCGWITLTVESSLSTFSMESISQVPAKYLFHIYYSPFLCGGRPNFVSAIHFIRVKLM